jgi:hypothetical protein
MNYPDALLTIAEISVALAGFAGIVMAVLSSGREKRLQDLWGLLEVLACSALSLTFSILPFALVELDINQESAVGVASGGLGVVIAGALIFVLFGQVKTKPRLPTLFWSFFVLGIAACSTLITASVTTLSSSFALILGLLWLLLVAFVQFTAFVVLSWTNDHDDP